MFDYAAGRVEVKGSHDALVYLYRGFYLLGMDRPPGVSRLAYFLRTWPPLVTALILGPITFNAIYFLDHGNMTTSAFLTSFSGNINVWGVPTKLIAVSLMIAALKRAEPYIRQLDTRVHSAEEHQMVRQLVMSANRTVLQFCIVYALYLSSTIGVGMLAGAPGYGLYFHWIDPRRSAWEFFVQNVLEYVLVAVLLFYQVVDDAYPSVYIQIIRTHLQLLAKRVHGLGNNEQRNNMDDYKELVNCIVDHHCLLQLLGCVSPVISITLFIQFLITAALMGSTLVNLVFFADSTQRMACFTYIAAILAQISPTCYQASMLLAECDLLPLAIFHCNWLHQDKRFRKMLVFFMHHAQAPMALTALKTFPISLGTEVDILKFSFSLFTFLRKMDFGNQN